MVEVRQLTADDAEAFWWLRLMALESEPQAYRETAEEHRLRSVGVYAERLRTGGHDHFVIGAFEGASLVGMAGFYRKGEHAGWIWGVFVSPNHRGAGVGRAVMDGLLDAVKGVPQLREVHLEVAPSQAMARRLYQSCGFRTYTGDEGPSSEQEHMVYLLEE